MAHTAQNKMSAADKAKLAEALMNDNTSVRVIRNNEVFEFKCPFEKDWSLAVRYAFMLALNRALSDAADLYLFMRDKMEAEKRDEWPMNWNMKQMRTICKHKGDAEEGLMIKCLVSMVESNVIDGSRWKVVKVGYPLDAAGKVINDDTLELDLERIK